MICLYVKNINQSKVRELMEKSFSMDIYRSNDIYGEQ